MPVSTERELGSRPLSGRCARAANVARELRWFVPALLARKRMPQLAGARLRLRARGLPQRRARLRLRAPGEDPRLDGLTSHPRQRGARS